jgi:hypothetical protein
MKKQNKILEYNNNENQMLYVDENGVIMFDGKPLDMTGINKWKEKNLKMVKEAIQDDVKNNFKYAIRMREDETYDEYDKRIIEHIKKLDEEEKNNK